jgi:hypothetical protein
MGEKLCIVHNEIIKNVSRTEFTRINAGEKEL